MPQPPSRVGASPFGGSTLAEARNREGAYHQDWVQRGSQPENEMSLDELAEALSRRRSER